MERLWAPWRMQYILDQKPSGCIFCLEERDIEDPNRLVLYRTPFSLVMLNRYPYTHGHLLVAPFRHVSQLDDLPRDELHDLFDLLTLAGKVLKESLAPEGFNIGINLGKAAGAGVENHLHVHVVPRWVGDTNFMGVVAEVRVMVENLCSTYDRLCPLFHSARGGDRP